MPGPHRARLVERRASVRRLIPIRRHLQNALIASILALPAALGAPDPEGISYFETHIRPALVTHCYECHSTRSGKNKGGLRLDHRDGWAIGGDSGPAVVPGKPEESRLVRAIRYHDPDLEMPPDGVLPEAIIARFEEWIRLGAPDPREPPGAGPSTETVPAIDLEEGRRFWSFRPITRPSPPTVADTTWPRGSIDRFLLARLDSAGLQPAPDTDPHTLLRRLYNDLIGLPPTVGEIDQFLAAYARNPDRALEEKVDSLLAHPGFGERWGRHWLDLARYADSTGGGRAIPLPDAWRYRDYVIEAFRNDHPLDQLIREHLAGDLLPHQSREERIRNLVATGFLVLGPHNYENQDKELLDLEIVDEQLDTIGRAFLGMTIGCARCHDHKFDPIPARDYYALAGIFTSTQSVKHSNVSNWHKEPLPRTSAEEEAANEAGKRIKELETRIKKLKAKHGGNKAPRTPAPSGIAPQSLPGIVLDDSSAELTGNWTSSTSLAPWVGAGYLHDNQEGKGRKSALFRPGIKKAGRYEVRISYSAGSNRPANVPVTVHHAGGTATVLVDQKRQAKHGRLFHSLGTFQFEAGTAHFIRIDTTGTSGAVIVDAVQLVPEGDPPTAPKTAQEPPRKQPAKEAPLPAELKELERELKQVRASAPKEQTIMCVTEGREPRDEKLRIRGMPRNFGEAVPRGVLQVTQPAGSAPLTITEGSGRRELADWITSPANPLTARVLANRIWLHLFGHGLVRTPDNFGVTGEAPTHPALLDHLASTLRSNDWSTKTLIRTIVLSRGYRLSSTRSVTATERDPANHLLSHAHRRALDAETLRDTMLVLGDQLDPAAGGPSLPPGFKSEFGYQFTSRKRSIYVPVFRNTLYDLFSTFDFANPNFTVGKRSMSTTPTQSLFLLNSPFVHRHAAPAAATLRALAPDDPARLVRLAYLRTLCRPPSPPEQELALRFLAEHDDPDQGAEALQRALFCSIDFRYLP